MSYGELHPEDLASKDPVILHAVMLTRSELKVREAAYFLELLRAHKHNEAAVLYHLDAVLSSMRSITWVLQKEGRHHPDFEAWYAPKQRHLKDIGMSQFVDLRNESEKAGLEPPEIEILIEHLAHRDGSASLRMGAERMKIQGGWVDDPITRIGEGLDELRKIVIEAKERGLIAPPETNRALTTRMRVLREQPDGTWRDDGPPKEWKFSVGGIQERKARGDLH